MTIESAHIPAELKKLKQWVNWKTEIRNGKDKPTKGPKNPRSGQNADTATQTTWATFDEALARSTKDQNVDGIGFVFTSNDPYCGVDCDHCRDPQTGKIERGARQIIAQLNSYTEISPSGTGTHTIIVGKLPAEGRKKGHFET